MGMPLKSFEVVLVVDVDKSDERDPVAVRRLIWSAITRLSNHELNGAIVSMPTVRELRNTTER